MRVMWWRKRVEELERQLAMEKHLRNKDDLWLAWETIDTDNDDFEAEIKRLDDGIASLITQVNETIADGGETIILASIRDSLDKLLEGGE